MAKTIPISQNPQRYTQLDTEWRIQASPSISPLIIKKGVSLSELKPVLGVDGIIVKAGDWYMVSKPTLDALQASGNPHYSIETNGPVVVKGKSISIGKTVKMIEISVDKLKGIGDDLDIKNRKAGVASVEYIYEGERKEGIPLNLIRQMDYTLNPDISRQIGRAHV